MVITGAGQVGYWPKTLPFRDYLMKPTPTASVPMAVVESSVPSGGGGVVQDPRPSAVLLALFVCLFQMHAESQ